MLKLLIISESNHFGTYISKVLQPIVSESQFKVVGVVVHPWPIKTTRQKIKAFRKRIKGGVFVTMMFESVLHRLYRRNLGVKEERISMATLFGGEVLPLINVKSFDEACLKHIADLKADVMVLAGYHQLIKPSVIRLFPRGVLSYHYGDMRQYRGQPPVFWELLHGENSIGITVQQISSGIDAGAPVEETRLPIEKNEKKSVLEKRMLKESEPMMYKALLHYLDVDYIPKPLDAYGRVYTLPGLIPWLRFWFKEWQK